MKAKINVHVNVHACQSLLSISWIIKLVSVCILGNFYSLNIRSKLPLKKKIPAGCLAPSMRESWVWLWLWRCDKLWPIAFEPANVSSPVSPVFSVDSLRGQSQSGLLSLPQRTNWTKRDDDDGRWNIVFNLRMIETIHSAGPAGRGGKEEISDEMFGLPGDATKLLNVVVTCGRHWIFVKISNRMISPFKIIRCILYVFG